MRVAGLSIVLIMLLGGCSVKQLSPVSVPLKSTLSTEENLDCCSAPDIIADDLNESEIKVNDLEHFAQSITPYVEKNGMDKEEFYDIQNSFDKSYFAPWHYEIPPIKVGEASWPIRAFRGGYGSNLRLVRPEWLQELKHQSNFETFATINKKAITLSWMNIRVLPTDKPLYKNPTLPGEGYPFDLLQNSSVNYHEPVFISHTSKDGAWSYIFTNNASGWVKSDSVWIINDEIIDTFEHKEKVFIMQDNQPLYDMQGKFIAYSRIGMVLPLERVNGDFYQVYAIDHNGIVVSILIPQNSAHLGIQKINKNDLITLGNEMLHNTYGWGGMLGERDCSSMIRDMVTPFGIWLPRNSASQARKGEVITLSGLLDNEKLSLIKEKGIPFETILYLKGHVVLYVGTYEDTIMIMHNIWGIRTIDQEGKKGRRIIGKAVISTLELGAEIENYDVKNKLLTRVQSMNIFTKAPSLCVARKKVPKILSVNP
ncbi:SH3 domain-containing protein [Sulfuricurvum sp.]|uniref:SH3 domain-containing C40 family peptidase n=1 Tax=Sulfuricurvum sp. TaxID=2025608 RepID=UPI0035633975